MAKGMRFSRRTQRDLLHRVCRFGAAKFRANRRIRRGSNHRTRYERNYGGSRKKQICDFHRLRIEECHITKR